MHVVLDVAERLREKISKILHLFKGSTVVVHLPHDHSDQRSGVRRRVIVHFTTNHILLPKLINSKHDSRVIRVVGAFVGGRKCFRSNVNRLFGNASPAHQIRAYNGWEFALTSRTNILIALYD